MIVLASGSKYRGELLGRLGVAFRQVAADVDESPGPGELPATLARRLARSKAGTVALRLETPAPATGQRDEFIVVGSDQVCACGPRAAPTLLGKPGNHERAMAQLMLLRGTSAHFFTAVALTDSTGTLLAEHVDETVAHFRSFTPAEASAYLDFDQPYDCAGSFKSECGGIALLDALQTSDPTGLIGLPLTWLSSALRDLDVPLFTTRQ